MAESVFHGASGSTAFGVGRRHVISIGREAVAGDFGEDVGSAAAGMLVFFENEGTGTFGEDEAVAVFIKGAGGFFRRIVAEAERAHGSKSTEAEGNDGSFTASGEDDVGFIIADEAPGFTDALCSGGAGGDDGVVWARELDFHGNDAGGDIADHHRNHEGGDAAGTFLEKDFVLIGEGFEAADAGAVDYAGAGGIVA